MKVSVFIAESLDGFIARSDGGIDWLDAIESDPNAGDYGYKDFIATVDAVVMGRGTYEKVLTFSSWPYTLPVFLLSSTISATLSRPRYVEATLSGPPGIIVKELASAGYHSIYLDGGKTIQQFLRAGLVSEMTITTIPILIGTGISLFGPLEEDIKTELLSSKSFSNGVVQNHYQL